MKRIWLATLAAILLIVGYAIGKSAMQAVDHLMTVRTNQGMEQ